MGTKVDQIDDQTEVKRYRIHYPISAYTFPTGARIHQVRFGDKYIHVELMDGRILSVSPLKKAHAKAQRRKVTREKNLCNLRNLWFFQETQRYERSR